MSKLKFFKKFLFNRKEIGSIIPSSIFLAKKVVLKKDIQKSNVIIELWAGTWSFTKKIFEFSKDLKNKKIFIIEKDEDLYNGLIKKFPEIKDNIYNIDILDIDVVLKKNKIKKIDLIISWLPFKSLPLEVFYFVMKEFLPKYADENLIFIQFSYFKNFWKILWDYFLNINKKSCYLNIPKANIFRCKNLKKCG